MSRKSDIEQGILRVNLRLPVTRLEFSVGNLHFEITTPDHNRPFEIVSPYDAVSDLGDLVREDDDE